MHPTHSPLPSTSFENRPAAQTRHVDLDASDMNPGGGLFEETFEGHAYVSIRVHRARAMTKYSRRGRVCRTSALCWSLQSDPCHHEIERISTKWTKWRTFAARETHRQTRGHIELAWCTRHTFRLTRTSREFPHRARRARQMVRRGAARLANGAGGGTCCSDRSCERSWHETRHQTECMGHEG